MGDKKRIRKMICVDIPDKLHSKIKKLANSNDMKFNTLLKRLMMSCVKQYLHDAISIQRPEPYGMRVSVDFIKEWSEIKKKAKSLHITARTLLISLLERELKNNPNGSVEYIIYK